MKQALRTYQHTDKTDEVDEEHCEGQYASYFRNHVFRLKLRFCLYCRCLKILSVQVIKKNEWL